MEKKIDLPNRDLSKDIQKILDYVAFILQSEGLISADERIRMTEVLYDEF